MKRNSTTVIIFLLFLVLGLFLASCGNGVREESKVGKLLIGEHPLNELHFENLNKNEGESDIKPNKPTYFMFSNTSITFNVTLNDSNIVTMNLPISRVRFRYDEMIHQPYVKFKWVKGDTDWSVADLESHILYIVLFVNKEDVIYNPQVVQVR